MSCTAQLLPATLKMPDQELATRRTLSYFTIPNPGLTQYKYETFIELGV
jgi:hypothetical protein